jgi:hypothetical protein
VGRERHAPFCFLSREQQRAIQMFNEIISVVEYNEGFALIEDNQGKYLVTKESPEITELEFPRCWLTDANRDRLSMLT